MSSPDASVDTINAHASAVLTYVGHLVSRTSLPWREDITQEVASYVCDQTNKGKYNPAKSQYSTWAYMLCKRQIANRYRAHKQLTESAISLDQIASRGLPEPAVARRNPTSIEVLGSLDKTRIAHLKPVDQRLITYLYQYRDLDQAADHCLLTRSAALKRLQVLAAANAE